MTTDLHVLINRVLDGHASKAERHELDGMLVSDATARAEFEQMILGHNRLGMAFQALALPDDFANSIVDAHVRHHPRTPSGMDLGVDLPASKTPSTAASTTAASTTTTTRGRPALHGTSPIVSRATARRAPRAQRGNAALTWIGGMMAAAGLLALIGALAVTNLPDGAPDNTGTANAENARFVPGIQPITNTANDIPSIGTNNTVRNGARPPANANRTNAADNATVENPANNAASNADVGNTVSDNSGAGNGASTPNAAVEGNNAATNRTAPDYAGGSSNQPDGNHSRPDPDNGATVENSPNPPDGDDPPSNPDGHETDPNGNDQPAPRTLAVVVAKPDWQVDGSVTVTNEAGDETRIRTRGWTTAIAAFEEEAGPDAKMHWVEGTAIETGSTGHVVIVEGALAIYMESDTTLRLTRDANTARDDYPGDLILHLEKGEIAVEARRPMLELPEALRNALRHFDNGTNLFGREKNDPDGPNPNQRGSGAPGMGGGIGRELPLFHESLRVRTAYADIAAVRAGFDLLFSVRQNSTATTLKVFEGLAVLIELEDGKPTGVTLQVSSGENVYDLPIGGEARADRRGIDDRAVVIDKPTLESWVREARTQRTSLRLGALPFASVHQRERDDLLKKLDDRFSEALRVGFDPDALVALMAFADSRQYATADFVVLADTLWLYSRTDLLRARHAPRAVTAWLYTLVQKGARGDELKECVSPRGEGEDPWREWGPRRER